MIFYTVISTNEEEKPLKVITKMELQPDMVLGEARKGIKLTYTTDTRPTRSIIQNAEHSDLFVPVGGCARGVAGSRAPAPTGRPAVAENHVSGEPG